MNSVLHGPPRNRRKPPTRSSNSKGRGRPAISASSESCGRVSHSNLPVAASTTCTSPQRAKGNSVLDRQRDSDGNRCPAEVRQILGERVELVDYVFVLGRRMGPAGQQQRLATRGRPRAAGISLELQPLVQHGRSDDFRSGHLSEQRVGLDRVAADADRASGPSARSCRNSSSLAAVLPDSRNVNATFRRHFESRDQGGLDSSSRPYQSEASPNSPRSKWKLPIALAACCPVSV